MAGEVFSEINVGNLEAAKVRAKELSELMKDYGVKVEVADTAASRLGGNFKAAKELTKELSAEFDGVNVSIIKAEDGLSKLNKTASFGTDLVKNLVMEMYGFTDQTQLAKDKAEELNKVIAGTGRLIDDIGKSLGVALPQLKLIELLSFALTTTINWAEHSAVVNRNLYDTNANLGLIGEKSRLFDEAIRDVSDHLRESRDDVAKTALSMSAIGLSVPEIRKNLSDVYSLSKLWSEITPEKQMQMMSVFMKEFGMNGDQASKTMFGLYQISKEMKDIMPHLDIKTFVSQTQEVAVAMRKYGLEASDAIALTSTLTKLGIEQARIPELAKTFGEVGTKSVAESAYMAEVFLGRLGRMSSEAREAMGISPERYEELKRLGKGPLGKGSLSAFLEGPEVSMAKVGVIEDIIGKLGRGSLSEVLLNRPTELMTMAKLQAPELGGFGIEAVKELSEKLNELKTLAKRLEKGEDLTKDEIERAKMGRQLLQDIKEGKGNIALEKIFSQSSDDVKQAQKLAETQRESQRKLAEEAAKDTTKMKDRLEQIGGLLGDWFRVATGGAGQEAAKARVLKRIQAGETMSPEEMEQAGLTPESIREMTSRKSYEKIPASVRSMDPALRRASINEETAMELEIFEASEKLKEEKRQSALAEKGLGFETNYGMFARQQAEAKNLSIPIELTINGVKGKNVIEISATDPSTQTHGY